jgi:adenylate kinase family enzyme
MDRVQVIGGSAAGKSTVARELGKILGVEVIHLDQHVWQPGCRLAEHHEEARIVADLLDRPRWVIDGNYTASLPMRLRDADTVVVVDFPRWRSLLRALRRLARFRGRTRPDMGGECAEQLNLAFLKWIWRYPRDERPKLLDYLKQFGNHTHVVFLRTPRQVSRFLDETRRQSRGPHHGPARSAAA